MFRHEKRPFTPTAIASPSRTRSLQRDLGSTRRQVVPDVLPGAGGERLQLNLSLVEKHYRRSGAVRGPAKAVAGGTGRASSESSRPAALKPALQALEASGPLIHAATPENAEFLAELGLEVQGPAGGPGGIAGCPGGADKEAGRKGRAEIGWD